jgi:DNA-binding LytR/AlgR family response regulator
MTGAGRAGAAMRDSGDWILVVEDEPRLRDALVELLARMAADFGPVRAAGSAEEALMACRDGVPAIAFLDIRMPGMSGLQLADAIADDTRVVFVTAHHEHAVEAFAQGAVDYLLKPVSPERLQACLDRLRRRDRAAIAGLRDALRAMAAPPPPPAPAPLRWLTASNGRRTHLIDVDDIVYLKSDTKYTRLVCRDSEHLVEDSLKGIVARLDPEQFRQVHRSAAVNLREVLLVERDDDGTGMVRFRNHPDPVRISAPYLRELRMFLV